MLNKSRPRLRWLIIPSLAAVVAVCLFVFGANASAHRLPKVSAAVPNAPSKPVLSGANLNPAQDTPTSTPTQPVLVSYSAGPSIAFPGTALVLTYTVFSPSTQDVALGAGIRVNACAEFFYDEPNDRTLTVPAGYSTVSRTFNLPNTSNVSYDVSWGLWSSGFIDLYGLKVVNGAVSVIGPTATPGVPTIQDNALGPNTAYRGSSLVLTYTLYSPAAQQVGLGADVAPEGTNNFTTDHPNDRVVSISAGTSVVTRTFNLGTRTAGYYTVRWGVWNPPFTAGYDLRVRPGALTIWEVGSSTPVHSPTPRATPTGTATISPCDTPIAPTATFTFTATSTRTRTPTDTLTPTRTNTRTNTPSPTPTIARSLVGHVTWQGRPAQPHTRQQVPVTLTLKLGATEVNYPAMTTDMSGFYTVTASGLPNGNYSWRAKGTKWLARGGTVQLTGAPYLSVEVGLMTPGDCNNDNVVGVSDFTILKPTFGQQQGSLFYDDRADFTGDNTVNIVDFNLLKNNFGNLGEPPL